MNVTKATEQEQRFADLWDAAYSDLLRFVQRRVHPTHAEDVVGEVMLTAWRRLGDVPTDTSEARAWLFGTARKTLQNTRRRQDRHEAVATRLADLAQASAHAADTSPDALAARMDLVAVWPRLNPVHQEAIALAAFEELSAPEAALVLGISPTAFRLRLSRARRALRHQLSSTHDRRLLGDVEAARN